MDQTVQQLRPDSKGRITLGKLAEGVSSFQVQHMEDGRIILKPFVEIPAREKWLFNNPAALNAVKAGVEQAIEGNARSLGSFAQYADEDID
jgi:hypothetical protein